VKTGRPVLEGERVLGDIAIFRGPIPRKNHEKKRKGGEKRKKRLKSPFRKCEPRMPMFASRKEDDEGRTDHPFQMWTGGKKTVEMASKKNGRGFLHSRRG